MTSSYNKKIDWTKLIDEKFDQDARIALLNEYSSTKRSWAIIFLSFVVAFSSIIQIDWINQNILITYIVFIQFISQTSYAISRYILYSCYCHYTAISDVLSKDKCKKKYGKTYPRLYRLIIGVTQDVMKRPHYKILSHFGGFRNWAIWTLLWFIPPIFALYWIVISRKKWC